jgi:4-diphosphocytidyl-2-C-methyl-D-erythritol kinase
VGRELAADGACLRVRVPAKVNLFLAVRGVRDDGYHDIVTVMQTVGLRDELRVGVVGPPGRGHHPASRRRMGVELWTSDGSGLPEAPGDNLAVRAAAALGRAAGTLDVTPVEDAILGDRRARTVIDLHKAIPIAGGMAGGSADAAGALVALNELWGCGLDREALRDLAAQIGSDVPFCVVGGTALATGRGTALAQVLCRGTFHWVICTAAEPLSTAAVYRSWDDCCEPSEVEPDAVLAALRSEDAEALGAALHNDLQEAAFALRPGLRADREALLDAGALGAVVSGSGPTLLALAASAEDAQRLADVVGGRFARTVVAASPAGGPELRPC